jgi:hypothetical protein
VQVPHGEGVATHIDPESCAGIREGTGEALTGVRIGQATEPRKKKAPGADDVRTSEGKTAGYANRECPDDPAWSQNLACAYASCAGTGRSHGRPTAK